MLKNITATKKRKCPTLNSHQEINEGLKFMFIVPMHHDHWHWWMESRYPLLRGLVSHVPGTCCQGNHS